MLLRSTALSPGVPTLRRPLIRTRVREVPRFRRLMVETPLSKFEKFDADLSSDWPAIGMSRSASRTLVWPLFWIFSALSTATGMDAVSSGRAMRDPVTTISAASPSSADAGLGAFCAKTGAAQRARAMAQGAAPRRNLLLNLLIGCDSLCLQGRDFALSRVCSTIELFPMFI